MIKWLLLDELSHSKQGWTQELLSLHPSQGEKHARIVQRIRDIGETIQWLKRQEDERPTMD